ncbi:MAG: tetratricopeptide repeat protein [Acidobacteria bacterium]|nr:tetratricopeptide repeat protein [Acidobacteriota bacterium]
MNPLEKLRSAAQAVREALPDQRRWSAPELRAGEQYLEQNRYHEAEQCLSRLLQELDDNDAVRPQHGRLLVCLATAEIGLGWLEGAKRTAERAIDLLGDERLRASSDLSAAQELMGRIALERGDEGSAVEWLRKALRTQEEVRPVDIPAIAARAIALAGLLELTAEDGEAVELLQRTLERTEAALGDLHPLTAHCLSELGTCQSHRGLREEAMRNLQRALQIQQALATHDDAAVIEVLKLMAAAAQAAGDFEGAAGYFHRALNLLERQLGGNAGNSVDILMSLAGVESEMGHFGRATERLQQAISKAEVERLANLPKALEKLAVVYMLSGRLNDARVSLERARGFYEVNPGQYRMEIAANEEIHAQLRSYYHVEPVVAEAGRPAGVEFPAASVVTGAPVEAAPHLPQFEVFDEEVVRPAHHVSLPAAAAPETSAIAALANLLNKEHAIASDGGKGHLWVPAEEWERVVAALRSFDGNAGAPAPMLRPEPAPKKAPAALYGWEDLGFEYLRA